MQLDVLQQSTLRLAQKNTRARTMRTASKVCALLTCVAFVLCIFDLYVHPVAPIYANRGLWIELFFMCGVIVFAPLDKGSK